MNKRFLLSVLFLSITKIAFAQEPVSTFAGSNIHCFYNAASSTVAQLNNASGIFYAPTGLIYIADADNNAVRAVNTATGNIITIAGNGVLGFSGDGGPATDAQLNNPQCVALDDSGNVYVADMGNNRIRRINTSGIITTFAGTGTGGFNGDTIAATTAQLNSPTAVNVDRSGNVYISDYINHRIRKVNGSGIITTVAGTGSMGFTGDGGSAMSAQIDSPWSMTSDATGNLFISDLGNHRIRKVSSSGIISTIGGTGTAGYSGDGGPATAARINKPWGLVADATGNLFISDYGNSRVRKINTTGIISTVAGSGISGYSGDSGPATAAQISGPSAVVLDTSGNLYISSGNSIRFVNAVGIISSAAGNPGYGGDGSTATAALLQNPVGVARDDSGNVFIADTGNHTVRMVRYADQVITTIAGTGVAGTSGNGGLATSATFIEPVSAVTNSSGDVFIADIAANTVRMIDHSTGLISIVAGNGTAGYTGDGGSATLAKLNRPFGLSIDATGNLFISDNGNDVVRKVDAITHNISTYAGNNVAGYSGDGGPATAAKLNGPAFIGLDAGDDLFIADENNNVIRKVNSSGIISTIFGNGTCGATGDGGLGIDAEICSPIGIAVDDSGGVSTSVAGKIRHVPPTGGPVTIDAGNGFVGMSRTGTPSPAAVFNGATGLCFDKAGNLLVADAQNRSVRGKGIATEGTNSPIPTDKFSLAIAPNPNNGIFELSGTVSSGDAGRTLTLVIYDINGQQIYRNTIHAIGKVISEKIILDGPIPGGVYFCKISGLFTNESLGFMLQK